MAVMLPNDLIWILDKLGLDWPDINEDEVHKAASLTRTFHDDLEALIQAADRRIVVDVAAGMRGKGGEAYVNAWNTQRSQNLQELLDALEPIATGVDLAADAVVALKVKFLAQLAWEIASLIPLFALGPLGAGAAVAKMIATKFAMGVIVDVAVSGLIDLVDEPIIGALKEQVPGLVQRILGAPIVEDIGAELGEFYADFQTLEEAEADMNAHSADTEALVAQFMADIAGLEFTE